ncbi:hypothetical protein ENBRE01_0376 [Enteropsectra breve]|nr:hypothetical protein ENBRE01_0376 [Enteropsectra breve]
MKLGLSVGIVFCTTAFKVAYEDQWLSVYNGDLVLESKQGTDFIRKMAPNKNVHKTILYDAKDNNVVSIDGSNRLISGAFPNYSEFEIVLDLNGLFILRNKERCVHATTDEVFLDECAAGKSTYFQIVDTDMDDESLAHKPMLAGPKPDGFNPYDPLADAKAPYFDKSKEDMKKILKPYRERLRNSPPTENSSDDVKRLLKKFLPI